MKRIRILIALACLLLPGLFTYVWFYSGKPAEVSRASLPDYAAIDFAMPTLSTDVPRAEPPVKASAHILLDLQHQNMYSISEIDPLVRFLESYGGSIQATSEQTNLEASLKSTDVFVTIAPTLRFLPQETAAINAFVKRGGALVVFADPTRNSMSIGSGSGNNDTMMPNTPLSGTDTANLLLEPFDISFADDYLYNMTENEGNFRNVIITDFAEDRLMEDVKQLIVYGGHSVKSAGKHLALTGENTHSSSSDHNGAYSFIDLVEYGEGSILAVGDVSLVTSQYVRSSDNQIFARNLARFLTSMPRVKTLADFPVIFSGDVVIQPAGKMEVNGDLISAVSSLEKFLQIPSGGLTIAKKPETVIDRIVLTTYESNDATKDLLSDLKINLTPEVILEDEGDFADTATPVPTLTSTPEPEGITQDQDMNPGGESDLPEEMENDFSQPAVIEAPYFQQVKTDNLGLVGLTRKDGKYTLVIMAASPEKLLTFVQNLSMSGLSACVVHDDLAACRVTDAVMMPQG